MLPQMTPTTPRLINFNILSPLWVSETLDNILTRIVSNYHFGKQLVARDMTICGSHVGPHVSENINSYLWLFHNWAANPSAKQIFSLLVCHVDETFKNVFPHNIFLTTEGEGYMEVYPVKVRALGCADVQPKRTPLSNTKDQHQRKQGHACPRMCSNGHSIKRHHAT